MSVSTVAPVAVKPDMPSKYASIGFGELVDVAEQEGQHPEGRDEQPDERHDEEPLARPDRLTLLLAGEPVERHADPGGRGAGGEERPGRLAVAERHGAPGTRKAAPTYLRTPPTRSSALPTSTPPAKSAAPRIARRHRREATARSGRSECPLDLGRPGRLGEDDRPVAGQEHVVAVREDRLARRARSRRSASRSWAAP